MKQPASTLLTKMAATRPIRRFLDRYSDQIAAFEHGRIAYIAERLVNWYALDEKTQYALRADTYTTKMAKQEILQTTYLPEHLRCELASLIDAAAVRADRPRYEMPVNNKGQIIIKPMTCYL